MMEDQLMIEATEVTKDQESGKDPVDDIASRKARLEAALKKMGKIIRSPAEPMRAVKLADHYYAIR